MTINLRPADLDIAPDHTYQDYLTKQAMSDGKIWSMFLDEERVDRTTEVLSDLHRSLEDQLSNAKLYQNGGEQGWRKRTQNLLRRVVIYETDAKNEVKRLDREEYEETAAAEKEEWKSITGLLVDLLYGSEALRFIKLPGQDFTAAQWGAERARRSEAKAVAA